MPILEEISHMDLIEGAIRFYEKNPEIVIGAPLLIAFLLAAACFIPKKWGDAEAGEESRHQDRQP